MARTQGGPIAALWGRLRTKPRGTSAAASLVAVGVGVFLLAPAASAKGGHHPPLGPFGSTEQPSFLRPEALAADQASGDLYVADVGVNETQSVKVSASAGQFKMKFGANTTGNLAANATAETVRTALRALPSIGAEGVSVSGGPGDASGSTPYLVTFGGPNATTDVPQLECENGTTPLSGGSGCTVTTPTPGIASKVKRFNADGTPHNFSALPSNALDNLVLSSNPEFTQIAIDNSCALHEPPLSGLACESFDPADGDVYVSELSKDLVDVFGSDGSLLGQLTGSSEGAFHTPTGVAVDENGALYVDDSNNREIRKYLPSGSFPVNADNTLNFAFPNFPIALAAGAGPSAGAIFVDPIGGSGELFKLDSSTGELKYLILLSGRPTTVSVDPASGRLYVARKEEVIEYDASGPSAKVVSTTSVPSEVTGIAVDATSGNLYLDRAGNPQVEVFAPIPPLPEPVTEAAAPVGATGATLRGTVNPKGHPLLAGPSEGCFFEWGETTAYGHIAPCEAPDAAEVGEGSSPVPVHAKVEGLNPGTVYHFRLAAANGGALEEGEDETLITLGPLLRGATASQITATGARIEGEADPHGKATSLEVQYVTEADFQKSGYAKASAAPAPPQQLGAGSGFQAVTQQLSGLAPATAYHFRLAAANSDAAVKGKDGTFATYAQAPPGLPDERAYEMVSPTEKAGGEVFPPFPVSNLDGSCFNCLPGLSTQMMPMQSSTDGEAVAYAGQPFAAGLASGKDEYLSGRSGSGWGTQDLSSPLFSDLVGGEGYEAFSADLSRSVIFQVAPTLSPQAPMEGERSYANLYLRDSAGSLQPLVTQAPPNREAGANAGTSFKILYAGANAGTAGTGAVPAFSHILFEANDALTGEVPGIAPAAEDGGPLEFNLYEWLGGRLHLVNVAPGNGSTEAGAAIGSGRLLDQFPLREAVDVSNAISADGRRVFWSDESGQLFVRIDGAETKEIKDPGIFETASADGAKALLSDGCLYSLAEEECEANLTQGKGGFKGILGRAEDLSRVYFIDTGALTGGEENANEEQAEEGKLNLYAWSNGATAFIGRLAEKDNTIGSGEVGDWKAAPSDRTAQVSAGGRYLAFMSEAPLSGYDNTFKGGGDCPGGPLAACQEVFEYDGETGKLSCASCDPTGQRPLGYSNLSLIKGSPHFPPLRQPANLSADGQGRLFFESQDTLSPRDANANVQDVYEWEPDGVGSCEEAGGCVFLISTGNSPNDSIFLDSSASGKDAFFITRQRLAGRDKDDLLDLYDARAPHVPGEALGFPEAEAPPCLAEACRGPFSSPPAQQGAGSSSFAGPGNEKPRPKKPKHKKHRRPHRRRAAKHKQGAHR